MILSIHPTTATAGFGRICEEPADTKGANRRSVDVASFPEDLRQWLQHQGLVDLSVRAVMSLDGAGSAWSRACACASACLSDRLLLLLTYCYAAGIYSSEDIEQQLQREPSIRQLCPGNAPDAAKIRRFRRTHRAEVDYCLGAVLGFVLRRERSRLRDQRPEASEGDSDVPSEVRDWGLSRRAIEGEAKRRVNWAVELDSMALDF
jgi:hypothetical protein